MDIRRNVSHYKKPILIVSGLLLVYCLLLAVVLPVVLKAKLPGLIQQATGRNVSVADIVVQPVPLAIQVDGLVLQEQNQQTFVAFDTLTVKISLLKSIGHLALVLDELVLKQPTVHIGKQKNGTLNFQDLLKPKPADAQKPPTVFPLNIEKLTIQQGKLVFADASLAQPVTEVIEPINLDIEELSTYAPTTARLGLSLGFKSGGQLAWQGTATLKPLSSSGHLKLDKVSLETVSALFLASQPYSLKGYEELDADYQASYADNTVKLTITKANFALKDMQLVAKAQRQTWLKLPYFSVQDLSLDLNQKTIAIAGVAAKDADIQAWLTPEGQLNYQSLLPAAPAVGKQTPPTATPEAPWHIAIKQLDISNFGLAFADQSAAKPTRLQLKPINLKVSQFSTQASASIPFEFSAQLNDKGIIKLAGTSILKPLSVTTAVAINDIPLNTFQAYVEPFAQLDIADGLFNLDGQLIFATLPKDKLELGFKGNSKIVNFMLKDRPQNNQGAANVLVKLPVFAVNGIDFNLGKQALTVAAVTADNADLNAWLTAEGESNYQQLLNPTKMPPKSPESSAPAANPPWKIKLNSLAFTRFGLNFEDRSLAKPVSLSLKPIDFKLSHYSNSHADHWPVELHVGLNKSGSIKLQGETALSPLAANLDVDAKNIDLEQFQPYLDKFVRVDVVDGALAITGKLRVQQQHQTPLAIKFSGDTGISSLLIRDKSEHKDLLKWENLSLKNAELDLLAQTYTASTLLIDKPYARIIINKNKTANFDNLLMTTASPKAAVSGTPKPSHPAQFKIAKVQIIEGSSDFADLSLILPFAAQIKSLDGGVNGISSDPKASISLDLKGNAYDLSPVDVKGKINPYQGDYHVELNFIDMPMPLVSPYMVQFAGYKVEKGKLTLGLKYNIANKELTASNSIMIDQFELGDRVDNPNAVSLPLKLAVALLKDASGKIKIDVPITGSMNSPQFSIRKIVGDALMNTLGKVVSSPFSLLSALGGNSKELSTIGFKAGNSVLDQAERTKLDALSKALKARDALNMDIKGAAFQEQDWPVIREDALYVQLKKRRALEINKDAETKIREEYVELSEADYKRLLSDMFVEKFPNMVKKSFFGNPSLVNPELGEYYYVAKQKLFTIIKPEQERLKELATARAQNIAKYFVKNGGIPRQRVYILDTVIDPKWAEKGVVSALSLNVAD